MKIILFCATVLLSLGSVVHADDFSPLGISVPCENAIFNKLRTTCNRDSHGDPDRAHNCLYSQTAIKRNTATQAYFEVDFTIDDAVVYWYKVVIADKNSCEFKISAGKR